MSNFLFLSGALTIFCLVQTRTKFLQILILALTFIFYATWSWRKGADIFIDFGLQLYLPWQLASGKLLYRDVAYLPGGPFSPYFNAALFKLFGVSLTTLILANLAIAGLMLSVLFRFFERISNSFCATAVCFSVLSIFAFSELAPGGNYNYVSPYSHDALHGLLFSVLAVWLFSRWILERSTILIFFAGLCVGIVFLTKPEVFLAIFLTTLVAFAIHAMQSADKISSLKSAGWFVLAGTIPPLIAFSCFRQFQSAAESLRAVCWAWVPLLTSEAAKNKYYIWCMGLDHPFGNSLIALMQLISVCIAVGLFAWCSRPNPHKFRRFIFSGLILSILIVALWKANWRETGRVLMLLTPAISGFLTWHWWKNGRKNPLMIPAILWSVFAVGMLAKLGFFSRFWHYGPFLAMPATVLAVYFVFGFLPGFLSAWNIERKSFLSIVSILLLTVAVKLWFVSNENYSMKTVTAGKGGDRLFAFERRVDPVANFMNEALDWIENNTSSNATLAVVPQGVMLNYLSRRSNPTPYTTFVLPEWDAFGEKQILEAYDAHRPDFIAVTYLDGGSGFEYGVGTFGDSERYGLKTMQWIYHHYTVVHSIRNSRFRYGIDIFRLNSAIRLTSSAHANSNPANE